MPIKIIQDFIPTTLPTRPQTPLTPQFIAIHNTDNTNKGAGAAAHNRYVRGADAVRRQVSWHYSVDDKAIYQHLPTDEVGWHANREGNSKSVGIEICMNSDMDVAAGYKNAAALVAHCVGALRLTFPGCMTQHHDWSGKNCPSAIRAGASMTWSRFLDLCDEEVARSQSKSSSGPNAEFLPLDTAPEWAPDDAGTILKSIDETMGLHHGEEP